MDGEQVTKDEAEEPSSKEAEQSSKEEPKLTQEQIIEKIVDKRFSDRLAKRGDEKKTLEERLAAVENENQSLKEERLETTAKMYGLTLEEAKTITQNPEELSKVATLFKAKQETDVPNRPDSGVSTGGSGSRKQMFKDIAEGNLDISELDKIK